MIAGKINQITIIPSINFLLKYWGFDLYSLFIENKTHEFVKQFQQNLNPPELKILSLP